MEHDARVDEPLDRRDLLVRLATLALGAGALGGTTAGTAHGALQSSPGQVPQGAARPVLLQPEDGARGQVGGNRLQFKVSRQDTGGACATLEGNLAPGYMGAVPHRHRGIDEVVRVLDGELSILVENDVVRVRAGGWHLRPRGQVHAFWNEGRRPVRFIEMYLPGAHEAYMRDLAALFASSPTPAPEALDALARRNDIEFFWDRLPPLLRQHGVRL
jgi:mannose-6-phosphate isomerase-like protein (cupin superfamily)